MKITAGLLSELIFLESIRVMTANCMNMQKSNKTIAGSIEKFSSYIILIHASKNKKKFNLFVICWLL